MPEVHNLPYIHAQGKVELQRLLGIGQDSLSATQKEEEHNKIRIDPL